MSSPEEVFDDIGERWMDDITAVKPSEIPDTVYHYTNAAGLEGALRSGKLWLTDFRFLNDSTEFTHATDILRDLLTERMSDPSADMFDFYRHASDFIDGEKQSVGYVFSLTTERDDLSQWRGYANDGSGFTIGFSGHEIFEQSESSYRFSRVRYDVANERRALELALKEIELKIAEEEKVAEDVDRLREEAGKTFEWLARNRASFNKHPSFHSENEWRLVSYRARDDSEVRVRVSGNRLVPYLAIDVGADGKLPIVSIGVGPGFTGSEVVDAVHALASSYGYDPEIYFADTPYRRP